MFYNIVFFFERPMTFFTSLEETDYTVSEADYELYVTGDYVKGEDGTPQFIGEEAVEEPIEYDGGDDEDDVELVEDILHPIISEMMEAIAMMSAQIEVLNEMNGIVSEEEASHE